MIIHDVIRSYLFFGLLRITATLTLKPFSVSVQKSQTGALHPLINRPTPLGSCFAFGNVQPGQHARPYIVLRVGSGLESSTHTMGSRATPGKLLKILMPIDEFSCAHIWLHKNPETSLYTCKCSPFLRFSRHPL